MSSFDESASSDHERADPSIIAMEIQERLSELKIDRDDRMNAVVQEADIALNDIQARYVAHENQRLSEEKIRYAADIQSILETLQRQHEIQEAMEGALMRCYETMRLLEDMILTGYSGREEDVKKCTE